MTQKELLYYEDAIMHESSIISIINDYKDKVSDELKDFFSKEISIHQNLKDNLINLLKEKANG